MPYWSGERLASELPALIRGFRHDRLDCASYKLSLGAEVLVTRDRLIENCPPLALTSVLSNELPDNKIPIPPGQFAFLLTEEIVRVPTYAMALISMRTRLKFKGLINVSGFHVDPGFSGQLLYSVYNAGPQPIILTRGDPLFIIVYADLDRTTEHYY